jgi:phosphoglucomutase
VLRTLKLSLFAVLVFGSPCAIGQSTLGPLLDAGAKKLTVEEFKAELVQRMLVGPTGIGWELEVMYTSGGAIAGESRVSSHIIGATRSVLDGEWRIDTEGRICSTVRSRGTLATLAPRCQFWFKLGDTYYVSDSDSDRYTKILPRKLK